MLMHNAGLFCIRYPHMMLDSEMRSLINDWLTKDCASTKKIEVTISMVEQPGVLQLNVSMLQVLRNLHNYLKEVELQLKEADNKCKVSFMLNVLIGGSTVLYPHRGEGRIR